MSRRVYMSGAGLRISKAGVDALSGPESSMLFSTVNGMLMCIDKGSFILNSNGNTITFAVSGLSQAPYVRCSVAGQGTVGFPVKVVASTTGFTAEALANFNGTKPAIGQTCSWFALMKAA